MAPYAEWIGSMQGVKENDATAPRHTKKNSPKPKSDAVHKLCGSLKTITHIMNPNQTKPKTDTIKLVENATTKPDAL